MDKQRYFLRSKEIKERAAKAVLSAPDGYQCEIKEPKRSEVQSAHFHALCNDIAKSGYKWAGKPRDAAAWKRLLISAHSVATGEPTEFVAGLEGEVVNVRESTALMSVRRASSLIEYVIAFCATNEIPIRDPKYEEPWN